MAGSARSAATKHAYRMFAPSRRAAARGSPGSAADEFDESDVWGSYGATGAVAAAGGGTFERGKMVFLEELGGGGDRKSVV